MTDTEIAAARAFGMRYRPAATELQHSTKPSPSGGVHFQSTAASFERWRIWPQPCELYPH